MKHETFVEILENLVYVSLGFLLVMAIMFFATLSPADTVHNIVYRESGKYGMEPEIVFAIIGIESEFNPASTGKHGEIGLMQLRPKFFPTVTYDIQRNIRLGIEHLVYVKNHCPHKKDLTWVVCYNRGVNNKIKNPKEFSYYKKFIKRYKEYTGKI